MRHRHPTIEGFVLAGGRSSRFGSDKALAVRHGRSLLSGALEALRGLDLQPWIVTPESAAYGRYHARFVTNERPGRGPVEGVRAALHACTQPWALILGVDMPGVTTTALQPLLELVAREPEANACCFRDRTNRRHPFPGLYHHHLLKWLDGSWPILSMQQLLERAGAVTLGPEDIPQAIDLQRVLMNANRPADL